MTEGALAQRPYYQVLEAHAVLTATVSSGSSISTKEKPVLVFLGKLILDHLLKPLFDLLGPSWFSLPYGDEFLGVETI